MKLNILSTAIVLIPLCWVTSLTAQASEPLPSSNSSALETSTSSPPLTHKYPPHLVQAFVNACNQPRTRNNQSINMEQVCTCSINKIQNQYSLEQFITLSFEMKDKEEPPKELMELALQCTLETLSSQR
jgi:hypothetical protein